MSMKYDSLQEMLTLDDEAKKYHASLPNYIQEQIALKKWSVNSFDALKDCAENLLNASK